jgi:uncharacterized protein (DUF2141 family)
MKNIVREQCLLLTLLLLIFQGCANPLPPSGGPRDTQPPSIIRTIPEHKTSSFKDKSIIIEFSEYVDRGKALQSIMIMPIVKYEASWSGKELELEFTEPLLKDMTYALTIGTDYADFAGNKPSQSHTIVFATGNTLDSGIIQGNVLGKAAGAFVFLIPIKDSASFDPTQQTSPYKTQIGSNGQFSFNALSNGTYRLYAIQDMFKDGLYDIGNDGYAIPSRDITIPSENQFISMKMNPAEDTISPMIAMAIQIEKGLIEVRCTEPILPESIKRTSFTLRDSMGVAIDIVGAYAHHAKHHVIFLEHAVDRIPMRVSIEQQFAPTDSANNFLSDTIAQRIMESRITETAKPTLHSISVSDSSVIDIKSSIELIFTHSINADICKTKISLSNGTKTLPIEVSSTSDNRIEITSQEKLSSDTWYTLQVDFTGMQDNRGISYQDTTLNMYFKTWDERKNGVIKGELMDVNSGGPYIIMLKNEKGKLFTQMVKQKGLFSITDLPAGTYSMEAFEDKNNDGKYDQGSLKPYRYAERIVQRKETITVRPRWTMDGINIQFQEP